MTTKDKKAVTSVVAPFAVAAFNLALPYLGLDGFGWLAAVAIALVALGYVWKEDLSWAPRSGRPYGLLVAVILLIAMFGPTLLARLQRRSVELQDFSHLHDVRIRNPTGATVYVTEIFAEIEVHPFATMTRSIDLLLQPGETKHRTFDNPPSLSTLAMIGNSWEEHYAAVSQRLGACLVVEFSGRHDSGIRQFVEAHKRRGYQLAMTEKVRGGLRYSIDGESREQAVDLVALTMVREPCTP